MYVAFLLWRLDDSLAHLHHNPFFSDLTFTLPPAERNILRRACSTIFVNLVQNPFDFIWVRITVGLGGILYFVSSKLLDLWHFRAATIKTKPDSIWTDLTVSNTIYGLTWAYDMSKRVKSCSDNIPSKLVVFGWDTAADRFSLLKRREGTGKTFNISIWESVFDLKMFCGGDNLHIFITKEKWLSKWNNIYYDQKPKT